jgi:hypothetical protein
MTAHPFIIARRASSIEDLQVTFHHIDAKRLRWLAEFLEKAQYHAAAELARDWALEHEMTAEKLSGGEIAA